MGEGEREGGCSGNERERERQIEGAGGSVRERTALSDAPQFAKSTSSTLTQRQSSGEQVFSCTNPRSLQPASIFTMAAIALSLSPPHHTSPRPPLRSSASLALSLSLSAPLPACIMPPWQRMAKRGHTASESLQTPPPAAAHGLTTANKEGETNPDSHTPLNALTQK